MAKFELVSEYKPAGDQPKAIEQLLNGLKQADHEQTLLGVTGSGKSVVYDSMVLIRRGDVIEHRRIGEVIENIIGYYPEVVRHHQDSSYINMDDLALDEQFETLALNPETGNSSWRVVTQISLHASEKTQSVRSSCGRSVETTDDHNFYVARKGRITLIRGDDIQVGDWLPVPRTVPGPSWAMEDIELISQIGPDFKAYIALQNQDWYQPSYLRPVMGSRSTAVASYGERLSLAHYLQLATLKRRSLAIATIGSNKLATQLPGKLSLSKAFLRFLGYYIAEGHAAKNYLILSTGDQEVVDDLTEACDELGLNLTKRRLSKYDYQINSSTLSYLIRKWCGGLSAEKHLPYFWPSLSNDQLSDLLSAYFGGDGGVERPSTVSAATVSTRLASDLQYALLRFGINGRVRKKRTRLNDRIYSSMVICITGAEHLKLFREKIGFTIARKNRLLATLDRKVPNTNVDLIPIDGHGLLDLRVALNLNQRDVAIACGVSRSYISLLETDLRKPSLRIARRLAEYFSIVAAELENKKAQAEVEKMDTLTALHWSSVTEVQQDNVTKTVYDFAVGEDETFLTGNGGIFVHNTFTMANIVAEVQRPTLVLCHNKTLAAQLYGEFRQFFPQNAVQYFVSYYDYYQPEAYIPRSDTYIEKDSSINEEIDRLRHAATMSLLTRRDVLIVASVSCIYGLGNVDDYTAMTIRLKVGEKRKRDKFLRQLNEIQYERNDMDFIRGKYRVRGEAVDIFPIGEEVAYRLEFFGDELERIRQIDPLTGEIGESFDSLSIFPGKHYVTPQEKMQGAVKNIQGELVDRVAELRSQNKLLEAQRLEQRTKYDLEMMEQVGFVSGIENYSRYLSNREAGEQPSTLLDYFPDDFLMFVDESHMTLPQVRGMFNGDRARKETLIDYGFRLPSALDNRPLRFPEFEQHINQVIYVSATPAEFEVSRSAQVVQQVIRPTGLLDPIIEVRPIEHQIDDLLAEIHATIRKGQRVLVTTLTKRMAEDLTDYLHEAAIKVQYLHSEVHTLDRTDILHDLRLGVYDVVVGINLLREGLDLPEVSLVAILDADKEGFLRSEQALIQTVGRAARHVEGRVIMYADRITGSMDRAITVTRERRKLQAAYNEEHGITPEGIKKALSERMQREEASETADVKKFSVEDIPADERRHLINELGSQMDMAAQNLQFEKAAAIRDQIAELKDSLKQKRAG